MSMAGLAESVLGVRGAEGLADAVRARVGVDRVAAARSPTSRRTACATSGMAVVLQRMVRGEAAGVMFTRAPDGAAGRGRRAHRQRGPRPRRAGRQRRDDAGRAAHRRARAARRVDHRAQGSATVVGRRAASQEVAVDDPDRAGARRASASSSSPRSPRVSRSSTPCPGTSSSRATPNASGSSRRARVTGRGFPDGGDADTVWSNVNVGEALPGVATPFTWSVAGAFSEAGFRRRLRGARLPGAEARAPRRQRARSLLSEPHAVHAHRGAGAVSRPAHARRARRRLGRRRAGARRSRT